MTRPAHAFVLSCLFVGASFPLFYLNLYLLGYTVIPTPASTSIAKSRPSQTSQEQDVDHGNLRQERTMSDEAAAPAPLIIPASESQVKPARGQHLILDLVGSTFEILNDKEGLEKATLDIVRETGMTLLGINGFQMSPQGVTIVATLAESHLSIHTWPEWGTALIDLFTCGDGTDLQQYVDYVVRQYGGNVTASTYSIIPRGDATYAVDTKSMAKQFHPPEIMTIHKYKSKVYSKQTDYQKIEIWDHHDTQEDDFTHNVMRSLFLDGVIQSNIYDEAKYHESLVHPAFIGSSLPPKRVLIVGGGEGGTLRETLKYRSVEKVVMVELDAGVIEASRKYLPSYSDCSFVGEEPYTRSCFDDPRLELHTEDFFQWFDRTLGKDICETRDQEAKKGDLFDVVVLDLLDSEALPEGQSWAEYLYSEEFFRTIACSVSMTGVVVTNFGEAPEGPFNSGPKRPMNPSEKRRFAMFSQKIEQVQAMSKFFYNTRVYDTAVPSYRANWAFALGMVPKPDGTEIETDEFEDAIFEYLNVGVNDFDGKSARVNLKLKRWLDSRAKLQYYDGAVQHSFQYPTGDWKGVYCMKPENAVVCEMTSKLFTEDYEEDWFELKLEDDGGVESGAVAKRDIPKGHVTGLWDAATSIEVPLTDYLDLDRFEESKEFDKLRQFIYRYGHDGGFAGTAEMTYTGLSLHSFASHACDGDPNFTGLAETFPWVRDFWEVWNPVADRIRTELSHVKIATRDIKAGEKITDDYTRWDGFMHNTEEEEYGHPHIVDWCGGKIE